MDQKAKAKFQVDVDVPDMLEGKWHELKGKVKQQWGKLTDDDLSRIEGKYEEFSGVLQQRYGYTRDRATQEIKDWLHDLGF